MNEKEENDLSWFSTYSLITVERVLERYQIRLPQEELSRIIKSPQSFYHQILQVPLKNIFNGIILQQAYDYQVYAQKLFIDYLLSGQASQPEESGEITREDIENERQNLVGQSEAFQALEKKHNKLIAQSQTSLIQLSEQWKKHFNKALKAIDKALKTQGVEGEEKLVDKALRTLILMQDPSEEEIESIVKNILNQELSKDAIRLFIEEALSPLEAFKSEIEGSLVPFAEQTAEISRDLRQYRAAFYQIILRASELIKSLPSYREDPKQEENRELLYFDAHLGEG